MGIYHIFIVSKAGGLIFNYDHKVGTCYLIPVKKCIPFSMVEFVIPVRWKLYFLQGGNYISCKVEIVFPGSWKLYFLEGGNCISCKVEIVFPARWKLYFLQGRNCISCKVNI